MVTEEVFLAAEDLVDTNGAVDANAGAGEDSKSNEVNIFETTFSRPKASSTTGIVPKEHLK